MSRRVWRAFCAVLLAAAGCQTAGPARLSSGSQPLFIRAQGEETVLHWWLRPLTPNAFPAPPEMAPMPIEKQKLPFQDTSIGLSQAVAQALRRSDVVRVLSGGAVSVNPTTQYDPAALTANRDAALAIFDPKISAGYIGSNINQPPSAFFGPGIAEPTHRDEGDFTASLSRLWQTGATSSISYAPGLGYLFLPGTANPSFFNPIYSSAVVLQARQPLLRGAGKAVNRVPIRIAQLQLEQSAWDFKDAMLAQVRSVEEAYWQLQAAYILLQATDTVIPLAEEAVRIEEARLQTEMAIRADVARAQVQLAQFRQQRLSNESNARQKENQLRNLIGMPAVDGVRLVPVDPPIQHPPAIDSNAAIEVAVENRPDLVQRRMGVHIRELQLLVAQNNVKPQLDLQALYRTNGVGQNLNDALNQAGILQFTDWTLGVTYSIPIGNRAARANARAAELQLARERALLRETVRNIGYKLADIVRDIRYTWDQYEQAQLRVSAAQEWMQTSRIRFALPPPSLQTQDALLLLLVDFQTAQRAYIDAVSDASVLISTYNGLLARLEEAQGTLLATRGIEISGDPVQAVLKQAVPLYLEPLPQLEAVAPTNASPGPVAPSIVAPAGLPPVTIPVLPSWTRPQPEPIPPTPIPQTDPTVNYRQATVQPVGWSPPR